jgi:hypothetical protein
MKRNTVFCFITLLFILNVSSAQEKPFWNSVDKTFLALNFPQASHTTQNSGFSLKYNFPAFMSLFGGEISLVYKNNNCDSYSFSLGMPYLLFGYNKTLFNYNNSFFYANLSIGTFGKGYMRSGGFSYLAKLNSNTMFEVAVNAFFHDGVGGGRQFIPITNALFHMRGILINAIYALKIFNSATLSFSSGISYTQYKYVEQEDYYKFVSKEEENRIDYIGKPKWKSYWMIPIGITISYHF